MFCGPYGGSWSVGHSPVRLSLDGIGPATIMPMGSGAGRCAPDCQQPSVVQGQGDLAAAQVVTGGTKPTAGQVLPGSAPASLNRRCASASVAAASSAGQSSGGLPPASMRVNTA